MRTLIVSDLHLGSVSRSDLLRRPEIRSALIEALADVDRLILLGDVLELRHGPLRDALAAARPFFEDIGDALAGRELLLTAGNHDHALVEPWLARRAEQHDPQPLGLEQLVEPGDASPAVERIAEWSAPARLRVAYPGIWVRPDVYAIHGHYLDSHLTVPTLERLSVGAMSRLLGRPAASFNNVADYEAVGAPIFAWRDAISRDARTGSALNGLATVAAWRALGGVDGASADGDGGLGHAAGRIASRRRAAGRRLRTRALVGSFPIAVAALNRAGLGPLRADISPGELRRAGLQAMGEVSARLGLADAHVVFGHTHRAGPLPGDREQEWRGPDGARLVNAGSWTYSEVFVTAKPGESPYWPGGSVLVEDEGPPQLLRLLQDRSQAELRPVAV
jgi:predicted phosphodiesterase